MKDKSEMKLIQGNVGIGATSPLSLLHVSGGTHIQANGTTDEDGLSVGTNYSGGAVSGEGRLKLWYTTGPTGHNNWFAWTDFGYC